MRQIKRLFDLFDNLSIEHRKLAKTSDLVSIGVGGGAIAIAYPNSIEDLCVIIKEIYKEDIKFTILGNGTNTYFTSEFYDGIVISTKKLNKVRVNCESIVAQCGASMYSCCNVSLENSLGGLEFAYGIPGFVGGALYMNASAFEKSVSKLVSKSLVYDIRKNKIISLDCQGHCFGEKRSIFMEKNFVVLETTFELYPKDKMLIYEEMCGNLKLRFDKQPINYPSAGSAFKRPENAYASRLIDMAGLKGKSMGGAKISNKHAGFIINSNNATSYEINRLIEYIKDDILRKFNIVLEEEIIYVE